MFSNYSHLGLGGIPLQRTDVETVKTLIKAMADDGFHVVDSAKGYTISEEWLGEALVGLRDNFFLCTKSMARDKETMAKDIDDSLIKFKTERIDLYQLHNISKPEEYERIMAPDGAMAALLEAKTAGKINHIGITSHSIDLIDKLLDDCPFETIQLPYNMIEEKAKATFKKAHQKGIKTLAMKPLCGGVLAEYPSAVSFFRDEDCCDVVLIGMADDEEYNANKAAFNREYTTEDKKKAEELKEELGDRFCRRCGYCLPCPIGINIPMIWLINGYIHRYGLRDWAMIRYDQEKTASSECLACGQCEERCPYHLPIIPKMKEVAEEMSKR